MSIVTKTGDAGSTSLLFGRRVPKDSPRVEACGAVDELSAALGVVRCVLDRKSDLHGRVAAIQQQLITLMGELATDPNDLERHGQAGFQTIDEAMIAALEAQVAELEAAQPQMRGWLLPGADEVSGRLHVARTACRRAERRVVSLLAEGGLPKSGSLVYLNRLADLLWLLAREAEAEAEA
jgi:cob(I)alamin adenosyltransferase